MSENYGQQYFESAENTKIVAFLKSLYCPKGHTIALITDGTRVLIARGEHDEPVDLRKFAEQFAADHPNVTLLGGDV